MGAAAVSEANELRWCDAAALSADELAAAASWLHDMDPDYYALFTPDRARREAAIAGLLTQSDSELGPTRFLHRDGQLVGLATWFPADEVFARRMASLKSLLPLSSAPAQVKAALKALPRPADTLPSPSLYLSKVCVNPHLRRSGLAKHILTDFMAAGRERGWDVCLNVHSDNRAAIVLYRKQGFLVPEPGTHTPTETTIAAPTYLLVTQATGHVTP